MSFQGFRGTAGGSVQSTYTDQPGQAYPGMLAFASDLNNCDAIVIGETEGIQAGKGVKFSALTDAISLQRPNEEALLPVAATANTEFRGIVVFDEAMQSDVNGNNGWNKGRIARILRPGRSGGRIYVKCKDAIDKANGVFWVTDDSADGVFEFGDFTDVNLGGGDAGVTVDISAYAKWVTPGVAGGLAILELI